MRIVTAASLTVAAVALAGCTSPVAGTGTPAPYTAAAPAGETTAPYEAAADGGLIPAQYPQCDLGAEILDYLATGDNAGDPGLDRVFADYVGVSLPQARALADEWIAACDERAAEDEAAAASSTAAESAAAAAAAAEAAQAAEDRRACGAIGGRYVEGSIWDGACESTVVGNPSGQPFKDCGHAWLTFPATEEDLARLVSDYPGCFP
ncbi:hypothetical protein GCM10027261_14140 [Geodermatophilus arenarius]|uniref:Septum formation n=1 Tax=Geodermatophilus arenarius TaxID=1137990 RepID=A0ABV9LI99_9ACTN